MHGVVCSLQALLRSEAPETLVGHREFCQNTLPAMPTVEQLGNIGSFVGGLAALLTLIWQIAHDRREREGTRPPSRRKRRRRRTMTLLLLAIGLGGLAYGLPGVVGLVRTLEPSGRETTASKPDLREETVPFEVFGPYTAVGCGESSASATTYAVPEGAYEIQSRCDWVETDGLKAQPCTTEVQGTTVRASGSIVGRDREWTGNCPGGGHGKLRLSGSYKHKVPK